MTLEERWQKANEEYHSLIKWANAESEKIYNCLKSEGKILGLDSCPEEFTHLHEELNRRVLALFDKYDLPGKPKL